MTEPTHILPLSFTEIALAISLTVKKRIGLPYLRRKLNRSTRMLERALDQMLERGLVTFYPDDRTYALTGKPIPNVTVQPYTRVAEAFTKRTASPVAPKPKPAVKTAPPPPIQCAELCDDFDDDDIDTLPELERAERIWRERMGSLRWRDDPRALAEGWNPENMRAPF